MAAMRMEFFLPGVTSLKEKRMLLQSFKDKVDNDFNVSVSEVENQDLWQRSVIGVASVSSDKNQLEKIFSAIIQRADETHGMELIDRKVNYY
ncbi:DUF503 domain-containing protein [Halarsenatibacter silvermanii]|uniref:DUF503 domain-containing protein n=1 Tax=Halarsenatibacter silvermanii TaxID=321763 RepID=UPI001F3D49A1|nr:DUF503 domain-containing protein [Halarsenatibacter silvermanii]